MKLALLNLLLSTLASADFHSATDLDIGKVCLRLRLELTLTNPPNISNVELGKLEDLHEFYSLMGSDFTKNLTFVDVTEYETLDATAIHTRDYVEGRSKNPKSLAMLQGRANECTDQTGWALLVCQNMPDRAWFWGAGGALTFYYLPSVMTSWLNSVGTMIQAGRDLRAIYSGQNGNEGLGKRAEIAVDYHFSLPYLLNTTGQADLATLSRRSFEEDGAQATFIHDFVFSEQDSVIYYKSTTAVLSMSASLSSEALVSSEKTLSGKTLSDSEFKARQTSDFTINFIVVKRTVANTIASPSCIADTLRRHIFENSNSQRFSCTPVDNQGSWRATLWLMINHGINNQGTYGYCC